MTQQYATTPIRSDVSPSLHPDALSVHAKVLSGEAAAGPGNRAYAEAREAFATIYETIGHINDTEAALITAAPPRQNGDLRGAYMDGSKISFRHGREAEFASAAEKAFQRAAQRCDRSMAALRRERDALEKRLSEAMGGEQGTGAFAAEVRSFFKSLPTTGDRLDAIFRAADARDTTTLRAVLYAPPYLSGLDASEQSQLRSEARRRLAPELHEQLTSVEGLIERVMHAGAILVQRFGKVQQTCATEAASPRGIAERKLRELAVR